MTPEASTRPKIPGKLYFRIGEVTEITGVQPYTLRHWESEFPTLNPKKNDAGQRLYRRAEIEMVLEIQRLLHLEGYTTAGARRLLSQRAKTKGRGAAASPKPAAAARPASPPAAPEAAATPEAVPAQPAPAQSPPAAQPAPAAQPPPVAQPPPAALPPPAARPTPAAPPAPDDGPAGTPPTPEPAPAPAGGGDAAAADARREAARRVLALMEENDRRLEELLGPEGR